MSRIESPKIGRPSEPGEYDDGMQALLQIIWGEGYLSPGGAAEVARIPRSLGDQIPDKPAIFAEVLRVLRPGGRFIESDWLRGGAAEYSAQMLEFFRLEGIAYNMTTLAESAEALRAAGSMRLRSATATAGISTWLDANSTRTRRDAGTAQRSDRAPHRSGTARHFIDNWRQLAAVLERGELRPGHLKAVKPKL